LYAAIILFLAVPLYSQTVIINAESEPLNKVLVDLRDRYDLQLSFNDRQLSSYIITLNKNFESAESAILELLKNLPLAYEERSGIFIIYPVSRKNKPRNYSVSGQVIDSRTNEALPYSHVLINDHGFVTDFKGNFSYLSSVDSVFKFTVSYLGYYVLDTIVTAGSGKRMALVPSSIDIEEIVVKGSVLQHSVRAGNKPGETRINHKVSGYLPGNGDNSVFNLLRLQPGILAAGEQSSDLIIWGSYEGHSKVVFDGFTIFGLRNYNDNISAVNPYLAKDIKVLKGGFGAEYGERVGGIVDITGIDGSTLDPHINFNINNMTLNGMASIPLFNQSSLVLAFRQTYYDLNDDVNMDFLTSRSVGRGNPAVDLNVYPDYLFRDMNFKYSGRFNNGDNYFVSIYSGGDEFSYSTEETSDNFLIYDEANEVNRQRGISAFYGKKWKRGGVSNFTFNYSGLNTQIDEYREVVRERMMRPDTVILSRDISSETSISEMGFNFENNFVVSGRHAVKFGLGMIENKLNYREDTFDVEFVSSMSDLLIFNAFLSDKISLGENLSVDIGFRTDYASDLNEVFFQPRVSANLKMGSGVNLNGAWGRYKQFIALSSVVDENGNYRYQWTVCDNKTIPVLSAEHFVGGISYSKSDFLFSIEGFYKTTDGLTRFVRTKNMQTIYTGDSRTRGMDFLIKKQFWGHTAWLAYTLSKTEEFFPFTVFSDYMPALHDQRHEIKIASIFDFDPLYVSANYVYGSGFPERTVFPADDVSTTPYSRLDASVVYKFKRKKYLFDAGISVLNVFNTENIKYSNFVIIPSSQTSSINLHAEAVPRTLTIFLNLSF
jgi:hypothetical protein